MLAFERSPRRQVRPATEHLCGDALASRPAAASQIALQFLRGAALTSISWTATARPQVVIDRGKSVFLARIEEAA